MNRREAREQAFFLIFEKTFKDEPLEEILEDAMLARDLEIDTFARKVFHGVEANQQQIDAAIEENVIGWKKNRLSRVAVSVLRIALFEMLFEEEIPVGVSINEAVEMTKHYEEPEVVSFVNGILGSFVRNECPPEPVGLKPAAERPQDEA